MQHTEARSVILEAYELLNAKQRSALIQEFYGKEFSLFKVLTYNTLNLNLTIVI